MKATAWRALGALAGLVGGIGLGLFITKGFKANVLVGFVALVVLIGVSVGLYLVARKLSKTAGSFTGEFMPGVLLGVNTGVNAALIAALVGPIVAIILCVLPALAVIEPVSRSDIYQAPLGWGNFLLPMSWPIVGLGLLFLIASGILALVNLAIRSTYLKIEKVKLQAKTGTTFLVGGLAGNANLSPDSTGYNMGTFAFLVHGKSSEYLFEHESGHTLNLAIWGPVIHLVGALDENVFGGHRNAYTELFAESNVAPSSRQGPIFPMWGEPVAATTTAPTPLTTPA